MDVLRATYAQARNICILQCFPAFPQMLSRRQLPRCINSCKKQCPSVPALRAMREGLQNERKWLNESSSRQYIYIYSDSIKRTVSQKHVHFLHQIERWRATVVISTVGPAIFTGLPSPVALPVAEEEHNGRWGG